MGIRVRLTEDVNHWRAGSTLGFADDRAAEEILGTGTFVVYDPPPAQPDAELETGAPAATEEAPAEAEAQPDGPEVPADTFFAQPVETETA